MLSSKIPFDDLGPWGRDIVGDLLEGGASLVSSVQAISSFYYKPDKEGYYESIPNQELALFTLCMMNFDLGDLPPPR